MIYYHHHHLFVVCAAFEVFCSGTWKAVEYLRVESGSMTMRLFENGHVLDDVKPFQRLRLRSRKATTIDCTTFLRLGVDVCVLYQKDEVTPEDDLEPVCIYIYFPCAFWFLVVRFCVCVWCRYGLMQRLYP